MKKLEIPVPKPYPVHVVYYKHISEDDPPPKAPKMIYGFRPYTNKYATDEDFQKTLKASQLSGSNNYDESFEKAPKASQIYQDGSVKYFSNEEFPSKSPKILNAYSGKFNDEDFPSQKFKVFSGNTKNQITDNDFWKSAKLSYGKSNNFFSSEDSQQNDNNFNENYNHSSEENSAENILNAFKEKIKSQDFPKGTKIYFSMSKNSKYQKPDENFPSKASKPSHVYSRKFKKFNSLEFGGDFLPNSRHEPHRFSGY